MLFSIYSVACVTLNLWFQFAHSNVACKSRRAIVYHIPKEIFNSIHYLLNWQYIFCLSHITYRIECLCLVRMCWEDRFAYTHTPAQSLYAKLFEIELHHQMNWSTGNRVHICKGASPNTYNQEFVRVYTYLWMRLDI